MPSSELLKVLTDEGSFLEFDSQVRCGVTSGLATICARPVSLVIVEHITDGNAFCGKVLRLLQKTKSTGTPLLMVFEGDSEPADHAVVSEILQQLVRLSGVCPLLALTIGPKGKLAEALLPYMDFRVFAGELASGSCSDIAVVDVLAASEKVRTLISLLPSNCAEAPTLLDIGDDTDRADRAGDSNTGFGTVTEITDSDTLCIIYQDLHVMAAFARIGGRVTGIMACDGSEIPDHTARFISFCDAFSLPVVFVMENIQGFFAPLVMYAFARATVPKICLGNCCGMKALFDVVLSTQERAEESLCDDSAPTLEIRRILINALELLSVKRDVLAPHKHGNAPFKE